MEESKAAIITSRERGGEAIHRPDRFSPLLVFMKRIPFHLEMRQLCITNIYVLKSHLPKASASENLDVWDYQLDGFTDKQALRKLAQWHKILNRVKRPEPPCESKAKKSYRLLLLQRKQQAALVRVFYKIPAYRGSNTSGMTYLDTQRRIDDFALLERMEQAIWKKGCRYHWPISRKVTYQFRIFKNGWRDPITVKDVWLGNVGKYRDLADITSPPVPFQGQARGNLPLKILCQVL